MIDKHHELRKREDVSALLNEEVRFAQGQVYRHSLILSHRLWLAVNGWKVKRLEGCKVGEVEG